MTASMRPLDVFPITTRHLEVLRVADVTPGMRRVTLGGAQLRAHVAANGYPVADFRSDGFDDELKLLLRHPDLTEALGPTQNDGILNWPQRSPHLVMRTYTVRRWDPVAGELDLDFVVHGVGAATTWARRVAPGESVQIAGPKMSAGLPVGADWFLVAGDETALPAIGRLLESWPPGLRGQVLIEISDDAHRQELPTPDGVTVAWLSREGAEPGTTTVLSDALRGLDWPDGRVFAWVAGESLTLAPIRRWLRDDRGLGRDQMDVTGYWRRREVTVSGEDPDLPDPDADDEHGDLHEMTELLPGFALRVAVTVGLVAALSGGPRDIAELLTATGCHPRGLRKLLSYLAFLGLVALEDGAFSLSPLGRDLDNEHLADALDLDGAAALTELGGLLSLLSAVRTGFGDHARWFGLGHQEFIASRPELAAGAVAEAAGDAAYVAGALTSSTLLDDLATIAVCGPAAGALAEALVAARPTLQVTVLGAPSQLAAIRTVHPDHDRVALVPGSPLSPPPGCFDAFLLAEVLPGHPDADAVHILRTAADAAPAVLVFGDVWDPQRADEHDHEDDLIGFALGGGGLRDRAELDDLFAQAALAASEQETVGWGYRLQRLTPRA